MISGRRTRGNSGIRGRFDWSQISSSVHAAGKWEGRRTTVLGGHSTDFVCLMGNRAPPVSRVKYLERTGVNCGKSSLHVKIGRSAESRREAPSGPLSRPRARGRLHGVAAHQCPIHTPLQHYLREISGEGGVATSVQIDKTTRLKILESSSHYETLTLRISIPEH